MGRWSEVKYRRSSGLSPELKVGGPSMLGIGCPDRHALPHITPTKHTDPDSCSLPRERVRSSALRRHPTHSRKWSALHPEPPPGAGIKRQILSTMSPMPPNAPPVHSSDP